MKLFESLILAFIKGGQLIAVGSLFYTFMGMLFHGKFVWVEPNIAILIFEISASALLFIGTFFDVVQTIYARAKEMKG
jgi:hypothetical protein